MQISRHKQVPFALMSWLWLANVGYVPKMTFLKLRFHQGLPSLYQQRLQAQGHI